MSKKVNTPPPDAESVPQRPNSIMPAFPAYDQDGVYQPGLTKTEYLTGQFVSAFLQAHGKLPTAAQLQTLIEMAMLSVNHWIPGVLEKGNIEIVGIEGEEELLP